VSSHREVPPPERGRAGGGLSHRWHTEKFDTVFEGNRLPDPARSNLGTRHDLNHLARKPCWVVVHKTGRPDSWRIMPRMTRARTRTSGIGSQPLIQLLLEAVLCAFVSLMHHVAAMLGLGRRQRSDDWHIAPKTDAPPQTPRDQLKDQTNTGSVRTHAFPAKA